MKSATYGKLITVCGSMLCMFSIAVTGCAPSIRYTRASGQKNATSGYSRQQNNQASQRFSAGEISTVSINRLQSVIESYIGTPYRLGGMSRQGFDCSGFVCVVFKHVFSVKLPHSSREMQRYGRKVPLRNAVAGDLIFFRNHRIGRIGHVGIYMGGGRFAHASVKNGVIYSNLSESYYANRFAAVRRIFE